MASVQRLGGMQRRRFLALLGVAPAALLAPRPLRLFVMKTRAVGRSTDLAFLSNQPISGGDLDVAAFQAFIANMRVHTASGELTPYRLHPSQFKLLNAGRDGKAAAARSA